jgi:hypothetical protein
MNGRTNVESLAAKAGDDTSNSIHLSHEEIETLKRVKLKLNLDAAEETVDRLIHAWHL